MLDLFDRCAFLALLLLPPAAQGSSPPKPPVPLPSPMGLAAGLWGSAPSAVRFQKPQMIFGGMAGFGVDKGGGKHQERRGTRRTERPAVGVPRRELESGGGSRRDSETIHYSLLPITCASVLWSKKPIALVLVPGFP